MYSLLKLVIRIVFYILETNLANTLLQLYNTMELLFQIIAAIGSIATFGAFVMLFRKDKDKQAQITKLSIIAATLENQAESLNKQNDLLAQQVDIFRNTSILKEQNQVALEKLRDIEEQKIKLSVKPNIWTNGGMEKGYQNELQIDISNKGEVANLLEFRLISDDLTLHNLHLPYELEKGKGRYIFAKGKSNKAIKNCEYQIDVIYEDSLKNRYCSTFIGKGAIAKITETKEIEK
ncbi:hypothetical protein SDC9_41270 [bioreactor metagenome]|uniref:Uncharacterized protein n=1 Tax=bioreactor metagenome TaxID=1076179 RepID=A0A644VUT7_9ZZZZ